MLPLSISVPTKLTTIKHEKKHIIKVLNAIGTQDDLMNDMKFSWEEAVSSSSLQYHGVHNMGVSANKKVQ